MTWVCIMYGVIVSAPSGGTGGTFHLKSDITTRVQATLLSYQLPVIEACCVQSFLASCDLDLGCAMGRFIASTAELNGTLQRCVQAEVAVNSAPDLLALGRELARAPECRHKAESGVWMAISVKDELRDLCRFLLHHWCLGVSHFVIYDESITSLVQEMVEEAARVLPLEYVRARPKTQRQVQLDAIGRAQRAGAAWVGFLDADEYLHVHGADLPAILFALPSNVGVASFLWEMTPAGITYADVGRGLRGNFSDHVKSFAHVDRVKHDALTNPHFKAVKHGFVQYLLGANTTMRHAGAKAHATEIAHVHPDHPIVLHFNAKASLVEWVRKIYRGTGDVARDSDITKLSKLLKKGGVYLRPPRARIARVDRAFSALVSAVDMSLPS